jgi:hypothetical protein
MVIEICVKYPGGPTRIKVTEYIQYIYSMYIIIYIIHGTGTGIIHTYHRIKSILASQQCGIIQQRSIIPID